MPLNDNILDAIKNRKYCLKHVEPADLKAGDNDFGYIFTTFFNNILSVSPFDDSREFYKIQ